MLSLSYTKGTHLSGQDFNDLFVFEDNSPIRQQQLDFCQKKMPDTCGVWEAGANDFIELNHFLTRFSSTCAVSCDFDKSLKPQ